MGGRIRACRKSNQYTQTEMAEKLGLSQAVYSKYEADKVVRPNRDTVQKMAAIFDVPIDYLLARDASLGHLPINLQKFCANPEAVDYIAAAFMKFQKDQLEKELGRQVNI